jgi:hypothetical protein
MAIASASWMKEEQPASTTIDPVILRPGEAGARFARQLEADWASLLEDGIFAAEPALG